MRWAEENVDINKGDDPRAEAVIKRLEELHEEDAIEDAYADVVKMSGRIYSHLSQKCEPLPEAIRRIGFVDQEGDFGAARAEGTRNSS